MKQLLEFGFDHHYNQSTTDLFNDNGSSSSTIKNGGKFDKNRHHKNRLN